MKTEYRVVQCVMALLVCWPLMSTARPRPPLPPWPELPLQRLQFDEPYAYVNWTEPFQPPAVDSSIWVESWSGYALNRMGKKLDAISLPMVANDQWNLGPETGAIRFWFKPEWSSTDTLVGTGPGHFAPLVELMSGSGKDQEVVWSLVVAPDGNDLFVIGPDAEGLVGYLDTPILWQAGQWHLISLSYTPEESLLHVDNQLVGIGDGLPIVPIALAGTTQLIIGTDMAGKNAAEGQLEELATFDSPLASWQVDFYYQAMHQQAAKGPITPEEEAAWQQEAEEYQRLKEAGMLSVGLPLGPPMMMESSSGFYFLQPEIDGTNVNLTLGNGETNKSYNLLFSSVLPGAYWSTTIIGSMGQTNFTVPMTNGIGFFRAEEGDDWDGDGIKNWMDADPSSTNVGVLTVTIDAPANGTVVD